MRKSSPQGYEQVFQTMLQQVAETVSSYARDTPVLERARTIREHPELLAAAPARVREMVAADMVAEANNLTTRLEVVRAELLQKQRVDSHTGDSMFSPNITTELRRLEAERDRLASALDEVQAEAEAFAKATTTN